MESMGKGDRTRHVILGQALELASEIGLEGLTIGALAKRAGMSKSGLYAHFDSKQTLQCEVLDAAAERFVDVVVSPALKRPRGLPRIEALFERWLRWGDEELSGGCPFVAAVAEFDDRQGPVRDCLEGHLRDMIGSIERAASIAVAEGHFGSELDTRQFAYEFWGILMAHHGYQRLLEEADAHTRAHRAFRGLVDRSRSLA